MNNDNIVQVYFDSEKEPLVLRPTDDSKTVFRLEDLRDLVSVVTTLVYSLPERSAEDFKDCFLPEDSGKIGVLFKRELFEYWYSSNEKTVKVFLGIVKRDDFDFTLVETKSTSSSDENGLGTSDMTLVSVDVLKRTPEEAVQAEKNRTKVSEFLRTIPEVKELFDRHCSDKE